MKKLGLTLMALLVFLGYQYHSSQPPADIFKTLDEIRTSFKVVYEKADEGLVTVDTSYLSPDTLEESDVDEVLDLMGEVSAYKTIGSCRPDCVVSVYVKNFPWPGWVGPSQYYRYSYDGLFEEEVVDDLDNEVKEGIRYPTCERTGTAH